ncbi:hypothetical protein [Catenovulum adriaticum]|uniref:Uncharacterized protein n=1 Tax=Catenovulum adriaticum TaxID=2984846 RepID=A0ABY7APP1_9ALTE|nr:hypothetical protein [Catenovulum sp. TS8]WAJ71469.1 hypothetical protein OLW01_06640 [Catenovulum sp. TS8]
MQNEIKLSQKNLFSFIKKDKTSKAERSKRQAYAKMLTLHDYVNQYPGTLADKKLYCRDCSSEDILAWGLLSRNDDKRVHSCNQCGLILWRSINK